jgi:NTP pyrophosphatase (non-canonical NTP hydrolase)
MIHTKTQKLLNHMGSAIQYLTSKGTSREHKKQTEERLAKVAAYISIVANHSGLDLERIGRLADKHFEENK